MPTRRSILEQPQEWLELQEWFHTYEDPVRPWNIAAISRYLGMPQPVVRALLRGPKDSPGMMRTAFTAKRLKAFQDLFYAYGYRPSTVAPVNKQALCRPVRVEQLIRPVRS